MPELLQEEKGQKKMMKPAKEWLRNGTRYWKWGWVMRIAEGKTDRKMKSG